MLTKEIWFKRLESISVINNAGLLDWQQIHTGTSNHIFKVTTEVGIWMVRINRAALGIDRHEEKRIMALIEPLGIGPKVIENNPESGHLITEFIDQPTWQTEDFTSPQMLEKLNHRLNLFHAIPYEYLPSRLDYRLKLYLKTIKKVPVNTTIELLDTIQKLDFLGFWQANNSLFHSDLNTNNLLGRKQLTIIDWEFAGQGHPLLDWLILEQQSKTDLSAYYPEDMNPVWIDPAKRMIAAMMNLWPHESP